MNPTETTKLMYAVLDGGASPEERSALEQALAAYPQLREEFDGLRRMFAGLDAMPRYDPPPGFAERVVALQRSMAVGDPAHQLFPRSGVIGPSGKDISVRNPSVNATRPRTPSESIWGNWQMAMSKRGMWIVGGVAAAVAAMFIGGVVDFPPSGEKATGTIAPARKAKGEQPGAGDVKLGDPAKKGKSDGPETPGGGLANQAGGLNNQAGGMANQAGGMNNQAGGMNNQAGGLNNQAGGLNNQAGGLNNQAGGMNNQAGGMNNQAGGLANQAGGMNNQAGGLNNQAGGMNNQAGGLNNSASGLNNSAGGLNNSAGGLNNSAGGLNNSAGGLNNSASGLNNSAGGLNNSASGLNNQAGGMNNQGGLNNKIQN